MPLALKELRRSQWPKTARINAGELTEVRDALFYPDAMLDTAKEGQVQIFSYGVHRNPETTHEPSPEARELFQCGSPDDACLQGALSYEEILSLRAKYARHHAAFRTHCQKI